MSNLKLKIAYLYPDILQGYSHEANIKVFYKRANERNIDISIDKILTNDKILASKYDFYYIGGDNLEMLQLCNKCLDKNKHALLSAFDSNVPILAINLGYVLMGKTFQTTNQIMEYGLGLLDIHSYKNKKHYSKIIGISDLFKDEIIVGFSSHEIITDLEETAHPFLRLKKGFGNNEKNKTDGAIKNNLIGSYITSPILAHNPYFCDYLIALALRVKYRTIITLNSLCDDVEWYAHNFLLR